MVVVPLALCALLFWGAVFLVFFQADGTSMGDFVLGKMEPLPDGLGVWHVAEDGPEESSEVLEWRYIHDPGWAGGRLTLQQRYRSRVSGDIVRVLPDKRVIRSRRR